jgi:predicted metal-dependent hydrolase
MMVEYILARSKRKTVALYIRNVSLEVRAPLKMPKRDIDRFVTSKEKWITDKLGQLLCKT